jgi:hypothetical protein
VFLVVNGVVIDGKFMFCMLLSDFCLLLFNL